MSIDLWFTRGLVPYSPACTVLWEQVLRAMPVQEPRLWKDLHLQNGYNQYCLRETNTYQEVNQMCNFDCGTVWQILCRLFGFGC